MSSNLKFAWDTTHFREDLSDQFGFGYPQHSNGNNYGNPYQEPVIIQQQPQVQYIPVQQPAQQYIPQQPPIVLNNSGCGNGGTGKSQHPVVRFIEFVLVLVLVTIFALYLIQSPDTVDGLSSMINNFFDGVANKLNSLEGIIP